MFSERENSDDHFLSGLDYKPVWDAFDQGVIITDAKGIIRYYNQTQARIDEITVSQAIGAKISDIYELSSSDSVALRCLAEKKPIDRSIFVYRTRLGKVVNSVVSAFPLWRDGELIGSICFIREYLMMEEVGGADLESTSDISNGTSFTFDDIIGSSDDFMRAVNTAKLAASTPSPIMIYGETGTGKELIAQSIHNFSSRKANRYVAINCAAIPENLLEGILFGTSKGAFTGSVDKQGLFERACGGTLVLDEVDSMPVGLQAKLLRVLQEKRVRRVGSLEETPVDVKIISSVNTEPHHAIKSGLLRMDLFYRLGVVFVQLPPLRKRQNDLKELVQHFITKYNRTLGAKVKGLLPTALDIFRGYDWPGNVRELEHVIEGAMNMVGSSPYLDTIHLPRHFRGLELAQGSRPASGGAGGNEYDSRARRTPPSLDPSSIKLSEIQEERAVHMISRALAQCKGNVTQAAKNLGISRQLLHYKMKKYGLSRGEFTFRESAD